LCVNFSLENRSKLNEELKRADAVVLTYACDQPLTLSRLSSHWLYELRRLEVRRSHILLTVIIIIIIIIAAAVFCFQIFLPVSR
jgi:hypothetical protein